MKDAGITLMEWTRGHTEVCIPLVIFSGTVAFKVMCHRKNGLLHTLSLDNEGELRVVGFVPQGQDLLAMAYIPESSPDHLSDLPFGFSTTNGYLWPVIPRFTSGHLLGCTSAGRVVLWDDPPPPTATPDTPLPTVQLVLPELPTHKPATLACARFFPDVSSLAPASVCALVPPPSAPTYAPLVARLAPSAVPPLPAPPVVRVLGGGKDANLRVWDVARPGQPLWVAKNVWK